MNNIKITAFLTSLLLALTCHAEKITFTSTTKQTTLIELYTSEGCSSCPPADQFLSQFSAADELWQKYIPLAFHVDYWDYIGWQDVFAEPAFSKRQRQHKKQANIAAVYTPGFVVNGSEWAGFFKPWRALPETDSSPGTLSLTIDQQLATVSFPQAKNQLAFNMAVVGMGLETQVQAGENHGKTLLHDFVVLAHMKQQAVSQHAFTLPLIHKHQPQRFAVVAWVSAVDTLQPIQAVGGFVPDGSINTLQ
ncbi:DUF1223 domain-containing protein [Marinicella sp. S1101]|uniref:DUF1223 domain-containing protein n=1 Tax=Marinicella marina TaxID=2996016 RepID=UPI002260EA72|nr:DUF1223 domain-containing protein [Marinicella marina]MCX7554975.1 DUF1223 domain-containing protein [Marinicella marina]MDJ1141585.1 DUF1223 domain-containing protein [Marinicella marina]